MPDTCEYNLSLKEKKTLIKLRVWEEKTILDYLTGPWMQRQIF